MRRSTSRFAMTALLLASLAGGALAGCESDEDPPAQAATQGAPGASSGAGGVAGSGGHGATAGTATAGGAGASGGASTGGAGGAGGDGGCVRSWGDCNGDLSDGCEIHLGTNPDHCGDCATQCPPDAGPQQVSFCWEGDCVLACDPGFGDCDGDAANGCEADVIDDPLNCGACGVDCTPGGCSNGVCGPLVVDATHDSVLYIAVDDTNLYLATGSTIDQVPKLGGPSLTLASGLNGTFQVRVDATHVYWLGYGATNDTAAVRRVPIGGGPTEDLMTASGQPTSLALDAQNAYVATYGELRKVPKAGGPSTQLDTGDFLIQLQVGGTRAAWVLGGFNPVIRGLDLTGGPPFDLAPVVGQFFQSISACDGQHYFYVDDGGLTSIPLVGGAKTIVLSLPNLTPGSMTVDDTDVWFIWAKGLGTNIYRVAKGGGFPVPFYQGGAFLEALAVDDAMVYWADGAQGPKVWVQAMPK